MERDLSWQTSISRWDENGKETAGKLSRRPYIINRPSGRASPGAKEFVLAKSRVGSGVMLAGWVPREKKSVSADFRAGWV